jgi:hypothetical protein
MVPCLVVSFKTTFRTLSGAFDAAIGTFSMFCLGGPGLLAMFLYVHLQRFLHAFAFGLHGRGGNVDLT